MKRLLALVLLAFAPASLLAQEAPPAPAQAPARPRLVGVILTGSQALLWDDQTSQYLLKKVGDELSGGKIVALEVDRVVIESNGVREAIEMAPAPGSKSLKRARRMPALIVGAQPEEPLGAFAAEATADPAPVAAAPAPAAPVAVVAPTPVAPVADAASIAAAPAPVAAAPVPVAAAPAPVAAVPAPAPVVAAPAPPVAAPAPAAPEPVVAAPAPPAAPAPVAAAPRGPVNVAGGPPSPDSPVVVIPRDVLDRELQDFGALSDQVSLARNPRGGFQLVSIQPGSFAARIGLAPGDIVWRIDGRVINGVEDASAAYAWLRITDHFTVDLVRGGRPVRMRYVIAGAATAQR